jgi:hypothetical protein
MGVPAGCLLAAGQLESFEKVVIPSAVLSREESAVSLPAASRFLADKAGSE